MAVLVTAPTGAGLERCTPQRKRRPLGLSGPRARTSTSCVSSRESATSLPIVPSKLAQWCVRNDRMSHMKWIDRDYGE